MTEVFTVVFFSAAAIGLAMALFGTLLPMLRRRLLFAAAFCFGVAGLLGLASIGIVLLALSATCLYLAKRSEPSQRNHWLER